MGDVLRDAVDGCRGCAFRDAHGLLERPKAKAVSLQKGRSAGWKGGVKTVKRGEQRYEHILARDGAAGFV